MGCGDEIIPIIFFLDRELLFINLKLGTLTEYLKSFQKSNKIFLNMK